MECSSSHVVDKSPYAYCDQYKQQSYAYMVDFNFCEAYVLVFIAMYIILLLCCSNYLFYMYVAMCYVFLWKGRTALVECESIITQSNIHCVLVLSH